MEDVVAARETGFSPEGVYSHLRDATVSSREPRVGHIENNLH